MKDGDYDHGKDANFLWVAAPGSPFRSLTTEEVADARKMAEMTVPTFGGPDNATWEQHHPVAREVWIKRGVNPTGKDG